MRMRRIIGTKAALSAKQHLLSITNGSKEKCIQLMSDSGRPDYQVLIHNESNQLWLVDVNQEHIGEHSLVSFQDGIKQQQFVPIMYLGENKSIYSRDLAEEIAKQMGIAFKSGFGTGVGASTWFNNKDTKNYQVAAAKVLEVIECGKFESEEQYEEALNSIGRIVSKVYGIPFNETGEKKSGIILTNAKSDSV